MICMIDFTDVRDEADENSTPLHVASSRAHKDVVEYLVEKAHCDVSKSIPVCE